VLRREHDAGPGGGPRFFVCQQITAFRGMPDSGSGPTMRPREPTAWAAETDGTRISGAASAALSFAYVSGVPRYVGRENVRKRLAPLEREPGRTVYADGAVRIETPDETIT